MKKWIFRLLTIFAVICALSLFGLKIVSGTSDSHKRGLEQAFSQVFGGEARFEELKTFNLIPQFSIEVTNLDITKIQNIGNIKSEHVLVSFGPIDLVTKSRRIEAFHLKNFVMSEGTYTPLELRLDDAGIYPNEKKDAANFTFTGKYGAQDLNGQFAMAMISGMNPKYFFNEQNEFAMNLGAVQISGLFHPYTDKGSNLNRIKMFAQKKDGRIECVLPDDKTFELTAFLKDVVGQIAALKSPADLTKLCDTLKAAK